tara:strand:+ start:3141 stop:3296 length:156 start_codon:yes stop_codon:yes gene_type:complete
MASFEKDRLKEQLAKDIKSYLEKGGVINKLPVCPEVTKIKKEIDRKYFNRF